MPNYDFLNLSSIDFENLSRDILQAKLHLCFECFTAGRDNGIDLRYSQNKENSIIVQCKRYRDFKNLFSNLRDSEVHKVSKLAPKRYILCTTVGLTPNQKTRIGALYGEYISDFEDIIGKDDLNNLLGLYPNVEKKHYKLWLSSTNILETIVHSRLYNQSNFELSEIKHNIRIFVMNQAFDEALGLIKRNNFVIISGIPGIGKTTLGRMLVYHLLASGYEDFIYILNNIAEGDDVYSDSKKQIFLYDDFLGTNFLDTKLLKNEDKNIIKFIDKINTSKSKILICTTREYILNQAKLRYEIFESSKLDISKCIVDLSKYSRRIRAEILYNHLFFSALPKEYIENVIFNDRYFNIINHKNYSPRIVEQLTLQKKHWQGIKPDDFYKTIIDYMNNPTTIWRHVFENQISNLSRCVMLILLTTNTPILIEDLKSAVQSFVLLHFHEYSLTGSAFNFNKSLKELENTFIVLSKDCEDNTVIEFQNPSIRDFLTNYLINHKNLIVDLIQGSAFINQLFDIFDLCGGNKSTLTVTSNQAIVDILVSKLLSDFEKLASSSLIRTVFSHSDNFYWGKYHDYELNYLKTIITRIDRQHYPQITAFVKPKLMDLRVDNLAIRELKDYVDILEVIKNDVQVDATRLIECYSNKLTWSQDILNFTKLKEIFPEEYANFVNNTPELFELFENIISDEYDNRDSDNLEYLLSDIEEIEGKLGINMTKIKDSLHEEIDERDSNGEQTEFNDEVYGQMSQVDDDDYIRNMFDSLRSKSDIKV